MTKVLVVLPNWFGETLFATPFLGALRRCRPDAWIATLGRPACREVLLHSPHVNELLDYDEAGRHAGPLGGWRLIRMLRSKRFDSVFVLRRSLSRTALLAAAGIPTRIGAANPKSGWLLTRRVVAVPTSPHKAASYLPLLGAVDCPAGPPLMYDYTVTEPEQAAARAFLAGEGLLDGPPLVVLHPGANWAHKRWPVERFAALGDRLAETRHVRIAVTGGPDDQPLAEAIRRRMSQPVTVIAGRTTVRQLAACLPHARLFVSNDTGILHIAAALRRPVVALYGPTSPQLTGPLGEPGRMAVLHHQDCCPRIPCYEEDHPGHPGMDSITVEEAYEAASKMVDSELGIRSAE